MAQDVPQIPRERYFDDQLLTVEDFEREAAYHSAHRELQTWLCYTAGVLTGLTAAKGTAAGQVLVSKGVAIDRTGRQMVLAAGARFGGATINAQASGVILDLNAPAPAYYDLSHALVWQLTLEADPAPTQQGNQWLEYPKLSLLPSGSALSDAQIALAQVTVTAKETTDSSSGQPVKTVVVTVETVSSNQVPAVLSPDRAPEVKAEKITGQLSASAIPELDAGRITSGKLKAAVIPELDAGLITTGTLRAAVVPALTAAGIPNLDAAKITSGKLAPGLIPELDARLITSGVLSADRLPAGTGGGSLDGLQAVWAIDVAVFAKGLRAEVVRAAASKSGFTIGLLRTSAGTGATYYALAIGFQDKLVSFTSSRLQAAGIRLNVYSERTAYDLAREGGAAGQAATDVQFVGLDPAYSFNLLLPDTQIPAASRGKIRSLVTVGTALANSSDASASPVSAASILSTIRDAVSPFSFLALTAAAAPPVLSPDDLAVQLNASGAIAAEAAPQIVAQQPVAFAAATGAARLIALLTKNFADSTRYPTQVAWALAASGVGAADATKALVAAYKLDPKTAQSAIAGAYPPPSVQRLIIQLQESGTSALDAAPQLKAAMTSPPPLQLGVLLRLNFAGMADTPLQMVQSLKNATYTTADGVAAALPLLFPKAPQQELDAAMKELAGT